MNAFESAPNESIDLEPRSVRALTEYMTVLDEGGDVFSVTTESGSEYRVDVREGRCTCPDAEYRDPDGGCKHVRRARYALGYQTSRTSGDELKQAELRYRRAFAKADAKDRRPHPNSVDLWRPERPTGMHHDTYEALLEDIEAARAAWEELYQRRLRHHVARVESRGLI